MNNLHNSDTFVTIWSSGPNVGIHTHLCLSYVFRYCVLYTLIYIMTMVLFFISKHQ